MGSTKDSEVVLLDSDSDSELQHVSKRQKLDPSPPQPQPSEVVIPPFQKPFQESDSESPVPEQVPAAEAYDDKSTSPALSESSEITGQSVNSSDLDELSAGDLPSNGQENGNGLTTDQLAMKRTIYETRKFLKTKGIMAFLEEYLPPTASSDEIYKLILKLGFNPRNLPPFEKGENLLQLIKLLHLAMKRVRQLRSRLDNFYRVEDALNKIKSAQKVLVITGAGISTSLEVFDLEIFHTDPSIFYSIAHMILPPDNIYAPLHKFIRLLQDKGKLLRNYTQNIDNLEANAGIRHDKMIQCHGSFAFATCVTCGYQVPGEALYPIMRNKEIAYCPNCAKAREKLMNRDDSYVEESYGDLKECDLIISIGTSLKVAPVADIVDKVPADVPQILINRDPIHHCNFDISFLGYCDDVAAYLCNRLGDEWALDHPQYEELLCPSRDNLQLETTKERGVYNIVNLQRESKMAKEPPVAPEEPDLVVLEPTL
ncbi:uncharacterized protein CXQ87_000715 [Candidozyma duobushaemuli]|uniref:Deacetylase sirtuin-type domain-containing protein n=1 Tax=Candidozyma duobushaemuli TaxID=1231522 RepID=A0A2V1AHL9_9ASCO|nr:uncharacterized protein CXQ87_000715 [[Candida] duobushaemulonis]PVH17817.1 hypothetical protein CXQ87_000715 [[Candida] duobushaemulonis]